MSKQPIASAPKDEWITAEWPDGHTDTVAFLNGVWRNKHGECYDISPTSWIKEAQPTPPEGHEILPPDFLLKHGVVSGLKCRFSSGEWYEYVGDMPASGWDDSRQWAAPLGTQALVTTPAPERKCECGAKQRERVVGNVDIHLATCPTHPRNAYVKVLPGWLAVLKEKPEGLIYANSNAHEPALSHGPFEDDWSECRYSWPLFVTESIGEFAYAVPRHVHDRIEEERKAALFNSTGETIDKAYERLSTHSTLPPETPTPWRVVLTTPIFERHECEVVDIGHADKILTVNCALVDAELASLRRQLEETKVESEDNYEQGRKKGAIESGNGDLMRANERLRAQLADTQARVKELEEKFGWTYCAYCDAKFPADAPNLSVLIGEHIRTCEEHPIFKLRTTLAAVEEQLAERARERDQWKMVAEGQHKLLAQLSEYIRKPEGNGPFRYIQALDLISEASVRFTAAKQQNL